MRWTGLSIRDAVTLEKRRLARDPQTGLSSIIVHRKKTGEPVYCPVPPHVAQMLATVPASQKGNTNGTYFFWTGNGTPKTITTNWQRSYGKLFKLAAIKEADGTPKRCHPHMFRDTFAVESMLAGMKPIEVSLILGHSSVTITEKHYLPFVRRRQTSLNDSVVESWRRQGIIGRDRSQARAWTPPEGHAATRCSVRVATGFVHRLRMRCRTLSGTKYSKVATMTLLACLVEYNYSRFAVIISYAIFHSSSSSGF